MAIYSLNHRWVGRTTHQAGTASAHIRYITREDAATQVLGERLPTTPRETMAWLDDQEQADRKNARVCDKVMVALPRELSHEQRAALVRDFAETMTQGRASWVAAIHDREGKDSDNPHAHIVFRDRDHETKKRVMQLSEMSGTERLRETWENVTNAHLERAGVTARIDRRSLNDQGVSREAGIHIGHNAAAVEAKGERPSSNPLEVIRHMHGVHQSIIVDYPALDGGTTRAEANAAIAARNQARARGDRGVDGAPSPALDPFSRGGEGTAPLDARDGGFTPPRLEPDPHAVRAVLDAAASTNEAGTPPPREERIDKHTEDMEREDERGLAFEGGQGGVALDRALDGVNGGAGRVAEALGDMFLDVVGGGDQRPMSDQKQQQPQKETSGQAWAKAAEQAKAHQAARENHVIDRMQSEKGRGLNGAEQQKARTHEAERDTR